MEEHTRHDTRYVNVIVSALNKMDGAALDELLSPEFSKSVSNMVVNLDLLAATQLQPETKSKLFRAATEHVRRS